MFFKRVIWSPVEISYLVEHRADAIDQLTIALGKSRNAIKNKLAEIDGKDLPERKKTKNGRSRIGKRQDLGIFVRSGWEAAVLRYLNYKGIKWQYEPRVFFFDKIKHGNNSYTPDIYLPEQDTWIEVKGMLKVSDRAKVRRFKKFFPIEASKLQAVVGSSKTTAAKFFRAEKIKIYAYFNKLTKAYRKKIPLWDE